MLDPVLSGFRTFCIGCQGGMAWRGTNSDFKQDGNTTPRWSDCLSTELIQLIEVSETTFKSCVYLRCIQCHLVDMTLNAPMTNRASESSIKRARYAYQFSWCLLAKRNPKIIGRFQGDRQYSTSARSLCSLFTSYSFFARLWHGKVTSPTRDPMCRYEQQCARLAKYKVDEICSYL